MSENKMMLHCGGKVAEFHEVEAARIPEQTESYVPIPHGDLVRTVHQVAGDMLPTHTLYDSQFALAKEGDRMFGLSTWKNGDTTNEMGLTVAFRNSYDRSMSVGVAMGARVFVCDNLALSGTMASIKFRHTGNVLEKLNEALITRLYAARNSFSDVRRDAARLEAVPINEDEGFRYLGHLFGEKVLTASQFTLAAKVWRVPIHERFGERNAWSLYNSVNEGLKSSPVQDVIEKHLTLHKSAVAEFIGTESEDK